MITARGDLHMGGFARVERGVCGVWFCVESWLQLMRAALSNY